LFCTCQEAQIRHDARKLNYFAEHEILSRRFGEEERGQIFRIFLAEHIFNLPEEIMRIFLCAEHIKFYQERITLEHMFSMCCLFGCFQFLIL